MNRKTGRRSKTPAILAVCLLLISACGSAGSPGNEGGGAFSLDVPALGEKLYQELEFRDRLEELDASVVCALLGVEEGDIEAQKNYFSSGATAEEIIVFKAAGSEAADALRQALEARLADQMEIYASYAPEEVGYLKGAVLEDKGEYLVFCVAADSAAAKKLIDDAFSDR